MDVGAMLVLAFILLVGPLAYFFGADSRVVAVPSWWAPRRD